MTASEYTRCWEGKMTSMAPPGPAQAPQLTTVPFTKKGSLQEAEQAVCR
jgi:hypothetical protein